MRTGKPARWIIGGCDAEKQVGKADMLFPVLDLHLVLRYTASSISEQWRLYLRNHTTERPFKSFLASQGDLLCNFLIT
jgi:hypothetical protein